MESRLLLFLALLLCLVVVGSHASGSGEKYWHAVLPKTPFPKALQDLLEPNSESKTVVDKDNDGMVTDGRQNLEDLKDIDDDPLSSNGFSKIPKERKHIHSQQAKFQYQDSAPTEKLAETTKDAVFIYEMPRNPQKMNLLHDDLPSSNGFSKNPKDASVAYEKPMHSQQAKLSVPTEKLSKIPKDIFFRYGNSRNSQQRTLRYDNSAPSKSLSEMVKDLYIIYEKPRNSQKTSLLHEKPNDSEQILKDDIASSKDLLKFLKNLSAYLYTKSKNSQSKNLSASKKDFSKINQDSDLPQAKQPSKAASGDRTIFYKYNDLHPGKKMTLLFTNAGNKVDFLPRQVAEKIPFSSDKVPQILNRFSIDPKSADAEVIKDTIGDCENHQSEELFKHCATSVESLVDQNAARLGRNIRVLSTPEGKKQEYTVIAGTRKISDDRVIVCHKERYPYAVYYCHEINDTELYTVPLMGADGTKLRAVTICHKGTSAWNPDYIAFQILKMKPGQPFCHFLPSDALVWFQTKEQGHDLMAYLQNISNQGAFDI